MQGSTSEMTVENVILRHSKRGMHILEGYLEKNYCEQAAEEILKLEKGAVSGKGAEPAGLPCRYRDR